ncbi:hypothetical protein C2869_02220 [Saccharobesus litoralis]|uniref:Response regulatory domain-containing protein n=1 Tax=Saccharobesus litoralis TaxID=2172099 RepID=A0A2S0VM92_9ALTE|nr:response regulator [Saccharobesus litoralis]AWB65328.1 hypothetical protein C2869_02220 [Saccharobesus litoralis]
MLVLLIDDNRKVRQEIRDYLSSQSHQVVEADNGLSGLSKLKQHKFDMVISDHIMPIMDGIKFCENALQKHLVSAKQLLVLSTKIEPFLEKKLSKLNVSLLSKPVRKELLQDKIDLLDSSLKSDSVA